MLLEYVTVEITALVSYTYGSMVVNVLILVTECEGAVVSYPLWT